jgi:hypothetical protein
VRFDTLVSVSNSYRCYIPGVAFHRSSLTFFSIQKYYCLTKPLYPIVNKVFSWNLSILQNSMFVTGVAFHRSSLTALQGQQVEAQAWEARRTFLAATAAAWSPAAVIAAGSNGGGGSEQQQQYQRVALLAVGCKAGCVQLWRHNMLQCGSSSGSSGGGCGSNGGGSGSNAGRAPVQAPEYVGSIPVTAGAYVTCLAWAAVPAAAAAAAAGGSSGGSSGGWGVLPGFVARQEAGDALLLAVGE